MRIGGVARDWLEKKSRYRGQDIKAIPMNATTRRIRLGKSSHSKVMFGRQLDRFFFPMPLILREPPPLRDRVANRRVAMPDIA